MTYGKVDFVDLLLYPLFLLGTLAGAGWLPALGPIDLQATLVTLPGPSPISIGTLVALLALVGVIAWNRPSLSGRGGIQLWIVFATVALVLGPPFVPLLEAVLSNAAAMVVAFLIQTGGYMSASWVS